MDFFEHTFNIRNRFVIFSQIKWTIPSSFQLKASGKRSLLKPHRLILDAGEYCLNSRFTHTVHIWTVEKREEMAEESEKRFQEAMDKLFRVPPKSKPNSTRFSYFPIFLIS